METVDIVIANLTSELQAITRQEIKAFTLACIKASPPQFWQKPSAFYAGHHPDDELQEWGNLRHVKRTVLIALILADMEALAAAERDLLISALIIHDIGKYGPTGNSARILMEHPDFVSAMVKECELEAELKTPLLGIVIAHMGRWGRVKPQTKLEVLGHYADCIASRHSLNIPVSLTLEGGYNENIHSV